MDFLKNNKIGIIGILLALGGVFVYLNYFSSPTLAVLTTTETNAALSGDLLRTLGSLNTIKLDQTVFTDPVFVSLSDYGVVIPPENVGRGNPFLPFTSAGSKSTITIPSAIR